MKRVTLALAAALGVVAGWATATDRTETLHVAFEAAETGFDPQAIDDNYSFMVCDALFDALYTYDYLARPPRLVPNTADGMPVVTDDGRTFTVKVKPGIFFADDPAFGGKPRELVAADYAYAIRRIFDPRVRSPSLFIFEHQLVGLDRVLDAARRSGAFDYDAAIEGLQVVDRYTLRFRFRAPHYAFAHWLTYVALAAVAREVVTAQQDASHRVMEHPVGTGAYRLKEWDRGHRILLEANPKFRKEFYPAPSAGSGEKEAAEARRLAGRPLPLTSRIEIAIVEEAQPRLLLFDTGKIDYVELPASVSDLVLDGDTLKPQYARRGIALHRTLEPAVSYVYFNMDDPLVGGYTPEKIALRRAIALSYDRTSVIPHAAPGTGVTRCPAGTAGIRRTRRDARRTPRARSGGCPRAARQVWIPRP
jgi:peptide/nickel transport system substrate-binding protein